VTGWEKNAVGYNKHKQAGLCPKCGSDNVSVEENRNGQRQSISFLCNECGSGDHFDGFIADEE